MPLISFVCGRNPADFAACLPEYLRLLNLVLEHKPNLQIKDSQGWTCLDYAARVGNTHAVSAILGAFEPSGPADPNGAGEVFAAPKPGLDPAPKLGVAPAPNAGDAPALPPKGDDVAVFPAGAFAPRVPVDPNAGGDFAPPNAGVEPAPNAGEVPAPKGLAPPPKAGAVPRPPIAWCEKKITC